MITGRTSRHPSDEPGFSPEIARAIELTVIVAVSITAAVPSLTTKATINFDSVSYLHLSLYRLPVVPFIYTALGHNFTAIVIAQTLVGVSCWGYLALCALRITSRPSCYIAALCVLFASSTDYVTHWYSAVLSDSLALSLLALLLGSLASWLSGRGSLIRLVVVAVLWAGTRDTNGYLLLLFGIAALVFTLVRSKSRAHMAAAIVAILGGLAVTWSASSGGIWQQPFQHVLTERILVDPSKTAWFKAHGMPVTPTLLRISGSWVLASQNTLVHSRALASFRSWMQTSGENTYLLYALSHPLWAIKGTFAPQQTFTEGLIRYYGGTPRDPWLPLFIRERFLIGEQWIILTATAIAGSILAIRVRTIVGGSRLVVWWVGVLLFGYVGLVVDWVGDSWEVGRHSVGAVMMIWVAASFLIAIGLGLSRSPEMTGR